MLQLWELENQGMISFSETFILVHNIDADDLSALHLLAEHAFLNC